jgi:hypothetical protein
MKVIGTLRNKKVKKTFIFGKDIVEEKNSLKTIESNCSFKDNVLTGSNGSVLNSIPSVLNFTYNKLPVVQLDFRIKDLRQSYSNTPYLELIDCDNDRTYPVYLRDLNYFLSSIQDISFGEVKEYLSKKENCFSGLFVIDSVSKRGYHTPIVRLLKEEDSELQSVELI